MSVVLNKFFCTFLFFMAVCLPFTVNASDKAQDEPVWKQVCTTDEKTQAKNCRIEQQLFLQQKNQSGKSSVGRLLNLTILKGEVKKEAKYMLLVTLPMGIDLRIKSAIRIDKGKQYEVEYIKCDNNGCLSRMALDNKILAAFKKGNRVAVGFKPFGSNKPIIVNASLKGFSKAFKALSN